MSLSKRIQSSVIAATFFVNVSGVTGLAFASESPETRTIVAEQILLGGSDIRGELIQKLQERRIIDELAKMGVDPNEVRDRMAGMTDSELEQVVKGQQREAGGGGAGLVVVVLLVVLIILLLRPWGGDTGITVVK